MKCPACSNPLSTVNAGEIMVEVCKGQGGCGGLWFRKDELKKFDEPHELAGEALLDIEHNKNTEIDRKAIRHCPQCADKQELCLRWYDISNEVEIDQCLKCSGIWLDVGELEAIRGQYKSEEERRAAAEAYLNEHLNDAGQHFQESSERRLEQWEEDISLKNAMRNLFGDLLTFVTKP